MPWVSHNPDERWNTAKLFAPHASKVLCHLARAAKNPKSARIAWLLNTMGNYEACKQCNFPESFKYFKQALEMRQALFPGNHADVAHSLNNLGAALS